MIQAPGIYFSTFIYQIPLNRFIYSRCHGSFFLVSEAKLPREEIYFQL